MSLSSRLGAEGETPSAMPQTEAAAATNNFPRLVLDGIINQKPESSMPPPEVPSAGLQFPLRLSRWVTRSRFPPNQSEQSLCQCHQNDKTPLKGIYKQYVYQANAHRFPMHRNVYLDQAQQQRFPLHLCQGTLKLTLTPQLLATPNREQISDIIKRFPLKSQQVDATSSIILTFPELGQIPPQRNLNSAIRQTTTAAMTRRGQVRSPPASKAPKEFPIIKKRFVSFPDHHQHHHRTMANDYEQHGGDPSGGMKVRPTDVVPTPPPSPTTTMTQMSRDTIPKIDTNPPQWTGGAEGAAAVSVNALNDVHNADDVHKVFDNELEAQGRRQRWRRGTAALNLNVYVSDAEGVGEQKEIEHQQAENFNDAFFGQRHDHNDNDNDSDYAMDVDGAKNKQEICEQSKLEKVFGGVQGMKHGRAEAHNELNMTKEGSKNLASQEQQRQERQKQQRQQQQQSICLAGEQTIDGAVAASNHQQQQQQLPVDLSDARETSPEQVDDPKQIPTNIRISDGASSDVQSEYGSLGSRSPIPSASASAGQHKVTRPNIELLKSSVRAFLDEGAVASRSRPQLDFELIELLTEAIEFLCEPTTTGNLWSKSGAETEAEAEADSDAELEASVQSADMTVSKVSEDRDSETIVVYPDQIDPPTEVDDNNNNNSSSNSSGSNGSSGSPVHASSEMKYELKTAVTTLPSRRLPISSPISPITTTPIPAAVPTLADPPISRFSATSRIRNLDVAPPPITPLLLGEQLKRNSMSSRDDVSIDPDSVLPERTRLRRQRRMRSQESVEEKPEDVIERLNKLKARISGALSEVKGVLKQYSTESEAEAAGVKWQGPPSASPKPAEAESAAAATAAPPPVTFRFVNKVRRRSYFDEAEEEKEQAKAKLQERTETKDNGESMRENHVPKPASDLKDKKEEQETAEKQENSIDIKPKIKDTTATIKNLENTQETHKEVTSKLAKTEEAATKLNEAEAAAAPSEPPAVNGEPPKAAEQTKISEKSKAQAKIDFLAKVQMELKAKSVKDAQDTPRATATKTETLPPAETKENQAEQPTPTTNALPNESDQMIQPTANLDATVTVTAPATVKSVKKKVVVVKSKVNNPRRASIAAVEPSKIKIEPAVGQIDALITQRRPSDSEAIVKRKKKQKLMSINATAAPLTSGNQKEAATTDSIAEETMMGTVVKSKPLAAATAEVNAVAAKSETKSPAKSHEGDEAEATISTATEDTKAQPKRLQIDEAAATAIANQAPASERGRRASLKLAELVGETVLVVPASSSSAVAVAPTSTTSPTAAAAAATTETVPAIISSLSESKEPINQSAIVPELAIPNERQVETATPQQVAIGADVEGAASASVSEQSAPQIAATLSEVPHEESSLQQPEAEAGAQPQQSQSGEATKDNAQAHTSDSLATMPELKVLAGPVQPVKIETVEQPHDGDKADHLSVIKKKSPHLKKLVRKNSIDKAREKEEESKLSNILRDKNKISELSSRINKLTPPKKQVKPRKEEQPQQEQVKTEGAATPGEAPSEEINQIEPEPEPEPEPVPELEAVPTPAPKKPRKIKKKVIIKRQKRRLSISDTFFLQPEPEEPKEPEIETIEKAIAYVTDDDDDEDDKQQQQTEQEPLPVKPLKSCLHVREYKIGDLVLYAERYRKTQVRWKRGRVLERITSISYKLEIEGKEVAAHVSYIKKYTGRKVRFGNKEYLEIDYEQVAEEERRAASYSIWNMV